MKVAIEEIQALLDHREAINDLKFDEIEWTLNGEVIPIRREVLEIFRASRLNNMDFVDFGFFNTSSHSFER